MGLAVKGESQIQRSKIHSRQGTQPRHRGSHGTGWTPPVKGGIKIKPKDSNLRNWVDLCAGGEYQRPLRLVVFSGLPVCLCICSQLAGTVKNSLSAQIP